MPASSPNKRCLSSKTSGEEKYRKPESKEKTDQSTVQYNFVDMNYKLDRGLAELSYEAFMNILIKELKVGREWGVVRLFLYPVYDDFMQLQEQQKQKQQQQQQQQQQQVQEHRNGDKCYFAIFIRKRDLYVMAVLDINGMVYEVGTPGQKHWHFKNSQAAGFKSGITSFGVKYKELFEGTQGNLCGVWIGFDVLNEAVMRIIVKRDDPFSWAWSVGIFAIMFSECARFVWFHDTLKNVMAQGGKDNIRMWKRNRFMCMLKNKWGAISVCARTRLPSDVIQSQPDVEKYTARGVDNLTVNANYAWDSLFIQTWRNYPKGADNGPTIETLGSPGDSGYGDGGGGYGRGGGNVGGVDRGHGRGDNGGRGGRGGNGGGDNGGRGVRGGFGGGNNGGRGGRGGNVGGVDRGRGRGGNGGGVNGGRGGRGRNGGGGTVFVPLSNPFGILGEAEANPGEDEARARYD